MVIETVATVIVIAVKQGALEQFHAGKLESSKCVAWAKNVLPMLGPLWGSLSTDFVHIGRRHALVELPSPYTEGHEAIGFLATSIRGNALLLYIIADLIFSDERARHLFLATGRPRRPVLTPRLTWALGWKNFSVTRSQLKVKLTPLSIPVELREKRRRASGLPTLTSSTHRGIWVSTTLTAGPPRRAVAKDDFANPLSLLSSNRTSPSASTECPWVAHRPPDAYACFCRHRPHSQRIGGPMGRFDPLAFPLGNVRRMREGDSDSAAWTKIFRGDSQSAGSKAARGELVEQLLRQRCDTGRQRLLFGG